MLCKSDIITLCAKIYEVIAPDIISHHWPVKTFSTFIALGPEKKTFLADMTIIVDVTLLAATLCDEHLLQNDELKQKSSFSLKQSPSLW